MKCWLTYLFVLCISLVLPRAGDRSYTEPRVILPADDNGDASKSIPEYVRAAGLEFEEHHATTADGYVVSLWRITSPGRRRRQPVIFQHGVLDNAFSYVLLGRGRSVAWYLATKGYDVWLGNCRGQTYSLGNTHGYTWFNPFSKYWDFSFHEMGLYDFPAIVEYVKNVTGYAKVNYVGHSQGATAYFVKATFDPDFINKNIASFIAIGPAMFMTRHKSNIVNFITDVPIFDFLYKVWWGFFWVLPVNVLQMLETFCRYTPRIYQHLVPNIAGFTERNKFDIRRWPTFCTKLPGGTSSKNLVHWAQLLRSGGKFQMFDYGAEKNLELYGQVAPKEYAVENLKLMKVPTMVLIGTRDAIISEESSERVLAVLRNGDKNQVLDVLRVEDYSHMDFLWGKTAVKDVYPHMERFLRRWGAPGT